MLYRLAVFTAICLLALPLNINAQKINSPNAPKQEVAGDVQLLTLNDCLHYALKNQPALNQSCIDEAIAKVNTQIATSYWLPQVYGSVNYTNYLQLPTAFSTVNGNLASVKSGVFNYSIPQFTATQNLFSTDALLASNVAKLGKEQAMQNTIASKINLISSVSKAFYDLLLSIEQIGVYKEDTARLIKNKSDAYHRYVGGATDKVDYKQASISLNNSMSRLKEAIELKEAKKAYLKQLMGYPGDREFNVLFDTALMLQEVYADTLMPLQYQNRIEFQQLMTAKRVQQQSTIYYKYGFLPSLSAFYNYNYEFESNSFSTLYNNAYPYSLFGLQLNIPIFSGMRRIENIHKSSLQEERIDWDFVNLKLAIYTQWQQAIAGYKSNLYNLHNQLENEEMAKEVYNIVKLQYREGIKTYLDVIIAESDLQTSEINYLNALFQVLGSKIDLQKAMGTIPTEI